VKVTAAAATPKSASSSSPLWLGLLLGTLLTGAVFAYSRRQLQVRRKLQVDFETREAQRKAEVSAKAGRRDEPLPAPNIAVAAPVSEVFVAPDLTATLEGMEVARPVTPLFTALEDTQDDIDASIAHGRYEDAERLLQKVIAAAPRNVAAKLRLAEVFYITERVEDFSALAEELQLNHRADLSNDEWRRVMRMGKVIAPERTLFAGPRAVSSG
jgi:Tetratricopeptide repeat